VSTQSNNQTYSNKNSLLLVNVNMIQTIFTILLFLEEARDANGMLRIISQWTSEIDNIFCAYSIAWQTAFDYANRNKLTQVLKAIVINWHEKRWISKLYMDQSVKQKVDQEETRKINTGRGVRQGCCLSPILLILFSDYLTKKALKLLKALQT
jgi:hypothetical protein